MTLKIMTSEEIEEYFVQKYNESHLPGLAAAILKDGEVVYNKGFGFADIGEKIEINPDTTFQIGSISKTFTLIAIMQQWEKGKFELDDDVNEYLPHDRVGFVGSKKYDDAPVTFRLLLTHTAGIGEIKSYSDILALPRGLLFIQPKNKPLLPLEDRLKWGIPCYIKPGTKYSYANHGISLLGYLVEQFSGESFHDYIRNHILEPLSMDRSDAYLSDRVKPTLAKPYKYKGGKFKEKRIVRVWGRPAGGIYSCVNDMIKYVKMLLNWGKVSGAENRIIKRETLELTYKNHFCLDPRLEQFGLIWHIYHLEGTKFLWHGGQTMGYNSSLHICPEKDLAVILHSNCSQNRPTYTIGRSLLWNFYGIKPDSKTKIGHPKASEISFLDKLTGYYGMMRGFLTNTRNFGDIGEFQVYREGRDLYLKSIWGTKKHGVRLYPADPEDPYMFYLKQHLSSHVIEPYEGVLFREDHSGNIEGFDYRLNRFLKRSSVKAMHNKFKIAAIVLPLVAIGILMFTLLR